MWTTNLIKVYSSSKKLNFWFFSSSFFTIDFKICLYARCFDTSHCPHDIFWLHLVNSPKLWENNLIAENFGMKFIDTFCFLKGLKNLQSVVKIHHVDNVISNCLVYRHILKSIVKKLEEKNQKFSFSKLDLSLSVHMWSALLLPLPPIVKPEMVCLF